jgi:peptidoglycan/LPS O-acetylase OafA/YrhL
VISGFLITSLLLSEQAKRGRVSLKAFYARRSLRIFPAAYAYLSVVAILSLTSIISISGSDFWHAATYTINYLPDPAWYVGHLWSLAVEEQFYLLWPLAFVTLGPRRATWAAAGFILLAPVARLSNRLFLIGTPYHDLEMFPMVADSLAMGCLLARLRDWLETQDWYLKLFRPTFSLLLLALVLVTNRLMGHTLVSVFGTSIVNIGLAILIHRSVYQSHDWVGQALNWKPLAMVGVLSYSLYLWQQLFLNRHSSAWVNAFPQNLLFAVAASLVSYLLLEKPLLQLRHRFRS